MNVVGAVRDGPVYWFGRASFAVVGRRHGAGGVRRCDGAAERKKGWDEFLCASRRSAAVPMQLTLKRFRCTMTRFRVQAAFALHTRY